MRTREHKVLHYLHLEIVSQLAHSACVSIRQHMSAYVLQYLDLEIVLRPLALVAQGLTRGFKFTYSGFTKESSI